VRRTPLVVALLGLLLSACGGDDHVTDERVDQLRTAAGAAGLSDEVTDVLALAAQGTTATFQVTYSGTGGAALTVSQQPPNRRIDVLTAGLIVESQVVRDGVAYRCDLPEGASPGDDLDCVRTQGALQGMGGFSEDAVATFTDELLASVDDFDLTVEDRTIADVGATCLIAAPKAGSPLGGTGPGVDTICLSRDGAQLLVDAGGERVVADTYSTTVPNGTFDV
jgi:hypothetical protein